MRIKFLHKIMAVGLLFLGLSACYDVEEGYRIDYDESSANFTVNAVTLNRGAVGDTIRFEIKAISDFDLKSIIVQSTTTGKEGTGYTIKTGASDPLIDHAFGTIKRGTREIDLLYNYIVSQDSIDVTINFSLIDEEGKKTATQKVLTVPSIVRYSNISLYTNTNAKTDGFSTADGVVYRNLPAYDAVSEVNQAIQESIDVIFIVSGNSAMFVAPYNGNFWTGFTVKNKTKFKKMDSVTAENFEQLTNASLSQFIDTDEVNSGTTWVGNVKVGDFIGFKTDFASKNSYKYGIMHIKAMHPANVAAYEGMSYVVEMDVVTQIKK
jgi:hypothetical protein